MTAAKTILIWFCKVFFIYIYCNLLFLLPCTGIASGLPIDLRPTLHITVVRVHTTQNVVCSIGIDVEEPDISKKLCPCYVYTT